MYRQTALLDKLLSNVQLSAHIMHPKKLGFTCTWFKHNISSKKEAVFSPNDIVVIPEVMVAKHAPLIHQLGIRYCIYVQNGYFICKGDMSILKKCYADAELILAISDDTTACIKSIFPEMADEKMLRMHYSVDASLFQANAIKQNVISYMPRKLPAHVKLVAGFLSHKLPPDWRLVPIENKSESETAEILASSKIFLSFSEFEGCPLPPVEAALAGNLVVGYTGEGGKEYFHLPNFKAVESGNIMQFCQQTLWAAAYWQQTNRQSQVHESMTSGIATLKNQYSQQAEINDLRQFVKKLFPTSNV